MIQDSIMWHGVNCQCYLLSLTKWHDESMINIAFQFLQKFKLSMTYIKLQPTDFELQNACIWKISWFPIMVHLEVEDALPWLLCFPTSFKNPHIPPWMCLTCLENVFFFFSFLSPLVFEFKSNLSGIFWGLKSWKLEGCTEIYNGLIASNENGKMLLTLKNGGWPNMTLILNLCWSILYVSLLLPNLASWSHENDPRVSNLCKKLGN